MTSSSISSLQLFEIDISFIVTAYVISLLSIALNSIEIHLIRKSWRKVTHFEIILLNLAVADTLSGIGNLACAGASTYNYVTKSGFTVLRVCFYFMIFAVSTSCCFVIMIAAERLKAIRKPFEQRARSWGEQGMFKCLSRLWVLVIICTLVLALVDWFLVKRLDNNQISSAKAAYSFGALLVVVSLLAFALYTWIAFLIFKQRNKLDRLYDKEYDRQKLREAKRQEASIIFVCMLIMSTFMVSYLPIAVGMFELKARKTEVVLSTMNCVLDPLIYFFKGYMERRSKVKRAVFSSDVYKEKIKTTIRDNSNKVPAITSI